MALCLFFASSYPMEVMPIKLAGFLLLSALIAAIGAGLREEPILASHFTRWDEAAASAALGLLVLIASPLLCSQGLP